MIVSSLRVSRGAFESTRKAIYFSVFHLHQNLLDYNKGAGLQS